MNMQRWATFSLAASLCTSVVCAEDAARPAPREASPAVVHPAVRSELRTTWSLDGEWDFAVDPKLQGESLG